jgi:hypothetical protein
MRFPISDSHFLKLLMKAMTGEVTKLQGLRQDEDGELPVVTGRVESRVGLDGAKGEERRRNLSTLGLRRSNQEKRAAEQWDDSHRKKAARVIAFRKARN